ncbi:MAG: DUF222 domain-containing protein [Geodermatophilaceae bacterium]
MDERSAPQLSSPIGRALCATITALDEVADHRCWSLTDREVTDLSALADRAAAAVEELRLRLLAAADAREVAAAAGASSTAAWLTSRGKVWRESAGGSLRLARSLDDRCDGTRRALAAGDINVEQAAVITRALADLPVDVSDDARDQAERWLLGQARSFGPAELRILGRRVFQVIAPHEADVREGKLLEADEARAWHTTRLTMRRRADGTTHGSFSLPQAQADMLTTVLQAFASPRRVATTGRLLTVAADEAIPGGNDVFHPAVFAEQPTNAPYPVRMGRALCELIEHLPVDRLARAAGLAAVVTVNLDQQALSTAVGAATLSTGTSLSAAQVRRWACEARIIPWVYGGTSQPLDLGRHRRLFTSYQRIALGLRDGGCVFPECDRPPAWCDAHHIGPWSAEGTTDLANGCLLCGHHHRLLHTDSGWELRVGADGLPEVLPPSRIDLTRRPRRNTRFRRRPAA